MAEFVAIGFGLRIDRTQNHGCGWKVSSRQSRPQQRPWGRCTLVSVWLTEAGLTLAQTSTDQKSNEITAIPDVLKLVDMSGAIISIDAMGTQTAIASQIIDGGGDYVLALKANQGGLHDAVIEYVDEHLNDDICEDQHAAACRDGRQTQPGRNADVHSVSGPPPI